MRIPLTCTACTQGRDLAPGEQPHELAVLREDGLYVSTCPAGHTMAVMLTNNKADILFESGAVALLCGFHREAVTSFATALERFYELAIRSMAHHFEVPRDVVDETWDKYTDRSERQLGAFFTLYAIAFKRAFKAPASVNMRTMAEVRNHVVHNGDTPTLAEAMKYGDNVYKLVRAIDDDLMQLNLKAMYEYHERERLKLHDDLERRLREDKISTDRHTRLYVRMILSREPPPGEDTFAAQLERVREKLSLHLPPYLVVTPS